MTWADPPRLGTRTWHCGSNFLSACFTAWGWMVEARRLRPSGSHPSLQAQGHGREMRCEGLHAPCPLHAAGVSLIVNDLLSRWASNFCALPLHRRLNETCQLKATTGDPCTICKGIVFEILFDIVKCVSVKSLRAKYSYFLPSFCPKWKWLAILFSSGGRHRDLRVLVLAEVDLLMKATVVGA